MSLFSPFSCWYKSSRWRLRESRLVEKNRYFWTFPVISVWWECCQSMWLSWYRKYRISAFSKLLSSFPMNWPFILIDQLDVRMALSHSNIKATRFHGVNFDYFPLWKSPKPWTKSWQDLSWTIVMSVSLHRGFIMRLYNPDFKKCRFGSKKWLNSVS